MRVAVCVMWLMVGGCFESSRSKGGGQISPGSARAASERRANPYDIDLPAGYRIDVVAEGLTFPTGVAVDARDRVYVIEAGYAYGERITKPRLLVLDGKELRELATGDGAPWNGIAYHDGAVYIAHGGELDGGRIVRYALTDGVIADTKVIVDGLPSYGDHHTNGPVITDDGWIYFGQGTATNSGVVGVDNFEYGWLPRVPTFHDVPCRDVTLTGTNWETSNPLTPAEDDKVVTGAYLPFGTPSQPGQTIQGRVPCSGAIMRVRASGGDVELVAWGLRNPFGLALEAGGSLLVAENGFDTRGSRPVFGAADPVWRIKPGGEPVWHGWPDHAEGRALTSEFYSESKGATRGFVLAEHPGKPPSPLAYLPVHAAATGLDVSRNTMFDRAGSAFVALFGDMAPKVGKVSAPVGFAVVSVDPRTGKVEQFARNRGDKAAPASRLGTRGLERPVAARFDRAGTSLYIVDFGVVRVSDKGIEPLPNTGKLWRITREDLIAPR